MQKNSELNIGESSNEFTLDIQVWKGRQAKYLVHGITDCLWTDEIEDVELFIKQELEKLDKR